MKALDIVALEDVSSRAWPALHLERMGGWRLHASTGQTGRANTCWALEAPDRPVREAIEAVEAWYAGHGLPARFKTVDGATQPSGMARRLVNRGYAANTETSVMVGPVGGEVDADVIIEDEPSELFQAVMFETLYRDRADAAERLDTLRRVPPPMMYARIDIGREPVAIGACAVEGEWAGISVMRTSPVIVGKGLAGRIVSALLGKAAEAGATRSYLQVEAANVNAVSLYETLGFETAYRYRYWAR